MVAAVTDPLSGQPESKHTPVRIEPWRPGWQAVLFCRAEPELVGVPYWVKVPGEGVIRYELAGTAAVADWRAWLEAHVALAGLRLEAGDPHGSVYHAVLWAEGWPVAALYVSSARPTIDREAISTAFQEPPADSAGCLAMLAGHAPPGGEEVGRIVCSCFRVGEYVIHKAIESGCTTAEALGASLKCGTNCGSCIPELKALIHSHAISKAA